jgi:hypothetical protein
MQISSLYLHVLVVHDTRKSIERLADAVWRVFNLEAISETVGYFVPNSYW